MLRLDLLRTRQFGNRLYVDVEIAADGNQTLFAAHAIAERVHDQIEAQFPAVKHCMVHVNPIAKA
ncbi:MAG: cation transporter dimerization domain-containing protein [Oscillospiraceae bacterium]